MKFTDHFENIAPDKVETMVEIIVVGLPIFFVLAGIVLVITMIASICALCDLSDLKNSFSFWAGKNPKVHVRKEFHYVTQIQKENLDGKSEETNSDHSQDRNSQVPIHREEGGGLHSDLCQRNGETVTS